MDCIEELKKNLELFEKLICWNNKVLKQIDLLNTLINIELKTWSIENE